MTSVKSLMPLIETVTETILNQTINKKTKYKTSTLEYKNLLSHLKHVLQTYNDNKMDQCDNLHCYHRSISIFQMGNGPHSKLSGLQ